MASGSRQPIARWSAKCRRKGKRAWRTPTPDITPRGRKAPRGLILYAQRVAPRTNSLASVQQISIDILGTRSEVRRRGGIIPSWVVFGMILLATFAVCVTVNMRTRARVHVAAQQLTVMQTDVEALRSMNQSLKSEVERLRTDPRTIEIAARARLNMVRSNEFVVPVE